MADVSSKQWLQYRIALFLSAFLLIALCPAGQALAKDSENLSASSLTLASSSKQSQSLATGSSELDLASPLSRPIKPEAGKSSIVEGTYEDGLTNKAVSKDAKYSDNYFLKDSRKVQKELAKLSMLASAASYDLPRKDHTPYSVSLMEQCGFKFGDKSPKYHLVKTTKQNNDHASYIIGWKKVGASTVVAIWIKGTGNGYEWVSNFNLGKGTTHKGFAKAEAKLYNSVKKYLNANGVTGRLKWWITGHSRGGGVANLFAKQLSDEYGGKRVYAYTFASPRVSASVNSAAPYSNIKNYLNPGDFVTEVAPAKWGYERYGKDITFTQETARSMKKGFKALTGESYGGFNKGGMKSLVKTFLAYAGKGVDDYYKEDPITKASPAKFFQKGLGYILARDYSGVTTALAISAVEPKAGKVLSKLSSDGVATKKFAHAHSQSSYLSWLDAMYE